MGISEIIAELQSGNGTDEQVGEALSSSTETFGEVEEKRLTDDVCLPPDLVKENDVLPSVVVEVPVKAKRGRKTVYDTTNLAVGESLAYDGKLSSGRVLASLKGGDGKKFQATETEGVVRITRKV